MVLYSSSPTPNSWQVDKLSWGMAHFIKLSNKKDMSRSNIKTQQAADFESIINNT